MQESPQKWNEKRRRVWWLQLLKFSQNLKVQQWSESTSRTLLGELLIIQSHATWTCLLRTKSNVFKSLKPLFCLLGNIPIRLETHVSFRRLQVRVLLQGREEVIIRGKSCPLLYSHGPLGLDWTQKEKEKGLYSQPQWIALQVTMPLSLASAKQQFVLSSFESLRRASNYLHRYTPTKMGM